MSRPSISNTSLNQHLTISECHPDHACRTNNWWLYDDRAGMNIGMREKTRDAAFVEAIDYWAERAMKAERAYEGIRMQVDEFVGKFVDSEDK
jgi:hypothetical protein